MRDKRIVKLYAEDKGNGYEYYKLELPDGIVYESKGNDVSFKPIKDYDNCKLHIYVEDEIKHSGIINSVNREKGDRWLIRLT